MKLTLRGIASNWRLKIAAFGLALLLWAVVSAEQVTSQWIPVRVEPVIRDPQYVQAGPAEPGEVRVRFVGPGRELWELALDRPTLVLPVTDVGDLRAFTIDPSMVRLPAGMAVSPQDVRPSVIRLNLQRLATRRVPIQARIGGRSLQQYVIEDVATLPAEVRLTGPADRLAEIRALATQSFEVVPDDSTFARTVPLDTAGMEGISFSRTQIRVTGRVDRRVERTIADVSVAAPDALETRPAQVEVRVQGPAREVSGIFPAVVRAVVPADSLPPVIPPGGIEAPLVVQGIPDDMRARATPLRVRVYRPGDAPDPDAPADSVAVPLPAPAVRPDTTGV